MAERIAASVDASPTEVAEAIVTWRRGNTDEAWLEVRRRVSQAIGDTLDTRDIARATLIDLCDEGVDAIVRHNAAATEKFR